MGVYKIMIDENKNKISIELKKLQRERNILKADIVNLKNELNFLLTNINNNIFKITVDDIVEEIKIILITYKE